MGNNVPATPLEFVQRFELDKLKIWLDGDEASRVWDQAALVVTASTTTPAASKSTDPATSDGSQDLKTPPASAPTPSTAGASTQSVHTLSRDDLHTLFAFMAEALCEKFLQLNAGTLVAVQKKLGVKRFEQELQQLRRLLVQDLQSQRTISYFLRTCNYKLDPRFAADEDESATSLSPLPPASEGKMSMEQYSISRDQFAQTVTAGVTLRPPGLWVWANYNKILLPDGSKKPRPPPGKPPGIGSGSLSGHSITDHTEHSSAPLVRSYSAAGDSSIPPPPASRHPASAALGDNGQRTAVTAGGASTASSTHTGGRASPRDPTFSQLHADHGAALLLRQKQLAAAATATGGASSAPSAGAPVIVRVSSNVSNAGDVVLSIGVGADAPSESTAAQRQQRYRSEYQPAVPLPILTATADMKPVEAHEWGLPSPASTKYRQSLLTPTASPGASPADATRAGVTTGVRSSTPPVEATARDAALITSAYTPDTAGQSASAHRVVITHADHNAAGAVDAAPVAAAEHALAPHTQSTSAHADTPAPTDTSVTASEPVAAGDSVVTSLHADAEDTHLAQDSEQVAAVLPVLSDSSTAAGAASSADAPSGTMSLIPTQTDTEAKLMVPLSGADEPVAKVTSVGADGDGVVDAAAGAELDDTEAEASAAAGNQPTDATAASGAGASNKSSKKKKGKRGNRR